MEPNQIKKYLEGVEAKLTPSKFNKVRQDIKVALKGLLGRTRVPIAEFLLYIPSKAEERPAEKPLHDADDLLDKITDTTFPLEHRALIAFELILNCRPQELYALTWADIDWDAETVTIVKRLAQVRPTDGAKTKFAIVADTKTGAAGNRVLPLGSLLAPMLRELQRERMDKGPASPYLFCHSDGTMLSEPRLRRLWAKIKATMGIEPGMQFYHLKTLGNSFAQEHGVSADAQAAKMRHSSATMARTAYLQQKEAQKRAERRKAVDVFDRGARAAEVATR